MHVQIWSYTLVSVLVVSMAAFAGLFTLAVNRLILNRMITGLVSLAAGSLLGDAFLHLIPEAYDHSVSSMMVPMLVLAGILVFFVLEKFVRWNHCHNLECTEHKHIAPMSIVGDAVHNFIDGMLIAASYTVDIRLGLVTTLAVLFHEIPQEIGDFGVLVYAGYTPRKALLVNFYTALTAFLGVLVVLILGQFLTGLNQVLVPLTAGGFIYIAGSDLIPELHHESAVKKSLLQFSLILVGMLIMALLTKVG